MHPRDHSPNGGSVLALDQLLRMSRVQPIKLTTQRIFSVPVFFFGVVMRLSRS
jgi:hypothetical protein